MVPSVAKRGSSFKGAGAYYLHDKGKDTDERVAWTSTHNLGTADPQKGLNRMAFTAMNAEAIKARNGTSRAGAKSQNKPVYAYSLAWHHTDQPSREEMETAAQSSLEKLGLKDHEAVIVCHQDQKHPHVHVIANLVNPQTGRTQAPKMDYNRLSQWAQAHDLEHGRNHCPLRKENNQKRYKDQAKTQFVKHNEERHERAAMFQAIADRAKTGPEFRAQLQEAGYTLAQGHKGRICAVNDRGEVLNLTRQLTHKNGKGYRVKDLRAKLDGVELKTLPQATRLRDIRQGTDRDGYAAEQDDKLFAAAIAADRAKEKAAQEQARREEQGERGAMRQKASETRQKQRHKAATKTRTPFREGGHAGKEFNQEVQDKGRKADDARIERMLKSVRDGKANDNTKETERPEPKTKTAKKFHEVAGEKKKTQARKSPARDKSADAPQPKLTPKSKGRSWGRKNRSVGKTKSRGKGKDGPSLD